MEKDTKQRKGYPSDISKADFARILPHLEQLKKRTRPRTVDLYEVFCALLYVLKSGCQWRMLPSDFPKWRTAYSYYQQWGEKQTDDEPSLLEAVLKKIGWRGPYQPWAQGADQFLYR